MNEENCTDSNKEKQLIENLHTILKNKKIVSAISKKSLHKHSLEPIPLRTVFPSHETKKETTESSVQVQASNFVAFSNPPITISPIKSEYKFSTKLDEIQSCQFSNNLKTCKSSKSSFSSNFNNIQSLIVEEKRISRFCLHRGNNLNENYFNPIRTTSNTYKPNGSKEFLSVRESIAEYEKRPIKSAFYSPEKYFNYKTKSQMMSNKKDNEYKDALMRFKKDNKHLYLRFNYFKNKCNSELSGFNIANKGSFTLKSKLDKMTNKHKTKENINMNKKTRTAFKIDETYKVKTK